MKATPLILTGLGMVVAWRAGMYNIGGEGQLLIGAVCGAWVAKAAAGFPPGALNILILVVCAAGGAAFAGLAGWLHVYRGVQAVISTILLNFVAVQILDWSFTGPLQESTHSLPLSQSLPDAAMLMRFDRQTDLHAGVFYALLVAVAVYVFLFFTPLGFEIRVVGQSPRAARAARIPAARVQLIAMMISGALCGLAGGIEYTGMTGQVGPGLSQQWGFLGIPVALLGGLHPLGVLLSGAFFGGLFAGSSNLSGFSQAGTTIVYIIQAVAVLGFIGIRHSFARAQRLRVEA